MQLSENQKSEKILQTGGGSTTPGTLQKPKIRTVRNAGFRKCVRCPKIRKSEKYFQTGPRPQVRDFAKTEDPKTVECIFGNCVRCPKIRKSENPKNIFIRAPGHKPGVGGLPPRPSENIFRIFGFSDTSRSFRKMYSTVSGSSDVAKSLACGRGPATRTVLRIGCPIRSVG